MIHSLIIALAICAAAAVANAVWIVTAIITYGLTGSTALTAVATFAALLLVMTVTINATTR